jgi:hypothetical protein
MLVIVSQKRSEERKEGKKGAIEEVEIETHVKYMVEDS